MENTATTYCPDCGPAEVPHWIERWSARINPAMHVIEWPLEKIWTGIRPIVHAVKLENASPFFYESLTALKVGTINSVPDDKDNWRTKVIWEEADQRGIVMKEFRPFGLSRDVFWSSFDGKICIFDGLPRPWSASEDSLVWMDDKGIILKKFGAAGVPVPRGKSCATFEEAEKVFASIGGAVIVKPSIGSRSRHTYVGITDLAALRHAFIKAKELSPWPVVEEELSGFVFRITLVDGKVAGVMRREPPHVMGDGTHTVRELVETENKNPLRHGPIFHELHLDEDGMAALLSQNLAPDSIPAAGRMVILHPKVSRTFGASTTEFADDEIHPDNHELFVKMGRILNDPLVGIDFMIRDMGKSWREQAPCGIIECNSLPFIDLHHYPLKGKARNVAGLVWDMIYPASAPTATPSFSRISL